jgi:hypothetical protein
VDAPVTDPQSALYRARLSRIEAAHRKRMADSLAAGPAHHAALRPDGPGGRSPGRTPPAGMPAGSRGLVMTGGGERVPAHAVGLAGRDHGR